MGHPGDAEPWAGGTLALHARSAPMTIAVSRHEPVRMAEAETSAAILGARLHVLPADASAEDICAVIRDVMPDAVITYPVVDVHPGHRQVRSRVDAAVLGGWQAE